MSQTTTPATVPAAQVIPFPTPWSSMGTMPAGCRPPGGGLDALNKCYWEVKQAFAFLSAMMVDLLNNDPNVQAAVAAAIAKAGPLAIQGVTSGVAATPGTVGETFQFTATALPVNNVYTSQTVPLGILPAGDWVLWVFAGNTTTALTVLAANWSTPPAGIGTMGLAGGIPPNMLTTFVTSNPVQALTSAPTQLIALIGAQGAAAGTFTASVFALRVR